MGSPDGMRSPDGADGDAAADGDGTGFVSQPVRVPKTADLIAARLRRQIVKGELREGESLPPEGVLLARFGVSRPTLREAFRVLETESLISIRRGSHGGARVHAPDADIAARYTGLILEYLGTTVGDVHAASAMIEPSCVAMLAAACTEVDLAVLRQLHEASTGAHDDPPAQLAAQAHFHRELVARTGNQTISLLAGMLRSIIDLADESYLAGRPEDPAALRLAARRGQRAHARLLPLLEERDATGAQRLWREHLEARGQHFRGGPGALDLLDLLG
ncbi:GntR domain protein [Frankia canadensis]|uniref:GntR domain protein n=1 Tax=Frankia canadensis TaxID=1836972 RepID=A0A2I2KMC1_9ACTN|nr:GntR family transcriptional regulator [Frankia canadensis]SNQ46814.1 GntR domain protein [Frankia canadensis]SOU54104.1 GntR domain protein [Frankia canadensis]